MLFQTLGSLGRIVTPQHSVHLPCAPTAFCSHTLQDKNESELLLVAPLEWFFLSSVQTFSLRQRLSSSTQFLPAGFSTRFYQLCYLTSPLWSWVLSAPSCPILCNLMDCSPPGSSVRGVSQARILEWVVIPFSRGSSRHRDWTHIFYRFLFTVSQIMNYYSPNDSPEKVPVTRKHEKRFKDQLEMWLAAHPFNKLLTNTPWSS